MKRLDTESFLHHIKHTLLNVLDLEPNDEGEFENEHFTYFDAGVQKSLKSEGLVKYGYVLAGCRLHNQFGVEDCKRTTSIPDMELKIRGDATPEHIEEAIVLWYRDVVSAMNKANDYSELYNE